MRKFEDTETIVKNIVEELKELRANNVKIDIEFPNNKINKLFREVQDLKPIREAIRNKLFYNVASRMSFIWYLPSDYSNNHNIRINTLYAIYKVGLINVIMMKKIAKDKLELNNLTNYGVGKLSMMLGDLRGMKVSAYGINAYLREEVYEILECETTEQTLKEIADVIIGMFVYEVYKK